MSRIGPVFRATRWLAGALIGFSLAALGTSSLRAQAPDARCRRRLRAGLSSARAPVYFPAARRGQADRLDQGADAARSRFGLRRPSRCADPKRSRPEHLRQRPLHDQHGHQSAVAAGRQASSAGVVDGRNRGQLAHGLRHARLSQRRSSGNGQGRCLGRRRVGHATPRRLHGHPRAGPDPLHARRIVDPGLPDARPARLLRADPAAGRAGRGEARRGPHHPHGRSDPRLGPDALGRNARPDVLRRGRAPLRPDRRYTLPGFRRRFLRRLQPPRAQGRCQPHEPARPRHRLHRTRRACVGTPPRPALALLRHRPRRSRHRLEERHDQDPALRLSRPGGPFRRRALEICRPTQA